MDQKMEETKTQGCERKAVMRKILARAVTDPAFAEALTCNARETLAKEGLAAQLGAPGIEFFEKLRRTDLESITLADLDGGELSWRFTLSASIQWD